MNNLPNNDDIGAITSLIWGPAELKPERDLIILGFGDGTVRLVTHHLNGFQLVHVMKPHRSAITSLAISPNGSYLVTAAADSTVFFFQMLSTPSPIGYINVIEGIPTSLDINPRNPSVLVMVVSHEIIYLEIPKPGEHETNISYLLPISYSKIIPNLAGIVSDKRARILQAESADTRKSSTEANETTAVESPIADDIHPIALEVAVPKKPTVGLVKFLANGNLYICFDGDEYGSMIFISEVRPDSLVAVSYLELIGTGPVSSLTYDHNLVIVSLMDGSVEIRKADDFNSDGGVMRILGHDRGSVHHSISRDQRLLVSGGVDGNLHVYRIGLDQAIEFHRLKIPDPEIGMERVEDIVGELPDPVPDTETMMTSTEPIDITDSAAYSFEEAKLKQGKDNERMAADAKKRVVREQIAQIRAEFSDFKAKCKAEGVKIDLNIDTKLVTRLQAQTEMEIDQTRKEMAWQSEFFAVALRKLRERYFNHILVERIELHCLRRPSMVTTFRTAELPPKVKEGIATVRQIIATQTKEDDRHSMKAIVKLAGSRSTNDDRSSNRAHGPIVADHSSAHHGSGTGITRKQERLARTIKRAELERQKPSAKEARPEDLELVRQAQENMGDYKLKSSDNYVVPLSQRVNAEQKKRQMFLVQEGIQSIKMGFNERFLALRDLKQRLVNRIRHDNQRIYELNLILKTGGERDDLFEPVVYPGEWPENRELVTPADLDKFSRDMRQRREQELLSKTDNGFGGGGTTTMKIADAIEPSKPSSSSSDSGSESDEEQVYAEVAGESVKLHASMLASVVKSPMERRQEEAERRLLIHERTGLIAGVDRDVTTFDRAVEEMRAEKFRLENDLKQAEIKMMVLHQELQLLRSFDDREARLTASLEKSRAEKAQVVLDLTVCQSKISDKLKEITEWQEKDQRISAEFQSIVGGDKNPVYPALLRIFRKKVKRSKKKQDENGEGSNHSDISDYDSDDGYSNDSNSESEEEEDSCPADCENVTYERVLELRERRLDHEDQLVVFNRAVDELKAGNERLMLREKSIDKDLRSNDADTESFQSEKQRALNRIDVVVPIHLSQFQCIAPGESAPPDNISRALVFTTAALNRLHERIQVLQSAKATLRHEQNSLKQEHKSLMRELRLKNAAIEVERKRCEDVQLLKFGRLVDIEELESASSNTVIEEMNENLAKLQRQWAKKTSSLEKEIHEAEENLFCTKTENTRLLQVVAALQMQQYELEDTLNTASESVHVADDSGNNSAHQVDERIRLMKLVQGQAEEIDDLKGELAMLKRKGGYLYGPGPEIESLPKPIIDSDITDPPGFSPAP